MPDNFLLKDNQPALPEVTLARVPYITKSEHGSHPAGTKCFAQRGGYPDFNIVLYFDDGTKFELPEWYHLDGYERPGDSIVAIEDRRCFAYFIWVAEKRYPDRYNRPKVI
jgi:hypothetical protein